MGWTKSEPKTSSKTSQTTVWRFVIFIIVCVGVYYYFNVANKHISTTIPTKTHVNAAVRAPWLDLRKGLHAYTGTDGGSSTTVTVCSTLTAYNDFQLGRKGFKKYCTREPSGVLVTIVSDKILINNPYNVKAIRSSHSLGYLAYIKANNGSWSGWIGTAVSLIPAIPVHELIKITQNNVHLLHSEKSGLNSGPILEKGDIVEVISQLPDNAPDLSVVVKKDPKLIGYKGWVDSFFSASLYFYYPN